jgi:hypothetical protein
MNKPRVVGSVITSVIGSVIGSVVALIVITVIASVIGFVIGDLGVFEAIRSMGPSLHLNDNGGPAKTTKTGKTPSNLSITEAITDATTGLPIYTLRYLLVGVCMQATVGGADGPQNCGRERQHYRGLK